MGYNPLGWKESETTKQLTLYFYSGVQESKKKKKESSRLYHVLLVEVSHEANPG